MIEVCLLGTGGMMPLPGRFLTALYLRHEGRVVLIDCGEGTQTAIRTSELRFKCIDAILITHFHGDHISGLPGLLLTLGNEDRTEPLHMYGPVGLKHVVNSLRVIVPELPYEIIFHELLSKDGSFECAGMEFTAFPLNHGMPCLGYSLLLKRPGKFDPVKAKANGVPLRLWSRLQAGETLEGFCPADVMGPPRKPLRLLYATDTRPVPALIGQGKEADLMILEGMFGEEEKLDRAKKSGHMMMREAGEIAREAGARELWLTHFSPANPEPEQFAEALQTIFPNTVVGTDGLMKTLRFEDGEI